MTDDEIVKAAQEYMLIVALDPRPGETIDWSGQDVETAYAAGLRAGLKNDKSAANEGWQPIETAPKMIHP